MTAQWTTSQLFEYMEKHSDRWRELLQEYESNKYIVNEAGYPKNYNFKTLLYQYFQSGANKIFQQPNDLKLDAEWILQNPKINCFIRHPLTGDTIWHKNCALVDILLPPIYDKKINSLMDVYASNKDEILVLENFYGSKVYNLLQDMNDVIRP